MALLTLKDIGKIYVSEGSVAVGIRGVNLSFDRGEFVAITGKSGSGKSTLLNVISGMDSYEEGELYIEGEPTSHNMFLVKLCVFLAEFLHVFLGKRFCARTEIGECPYCEEESGWGPCKDSIAYPFGEFSEIIRRGHILIKSLAGNVMLVSLGL